MLYVKSYGQHNGLSWSVPNMPHFLLNINATEPFIYVRVNAHAHLHVIQNNEHNG